MNLVSASRSTVMPQGMLQEQSPLLVAEIRHRMANVFQIMTSLIDQRRKRDRDPQAQAALEWAADLVITLSLLQEEVAATRAVEMPVCFRKIVSLWESLAFERGITIRLEATTAVALRSEQATALVLILQELLTNAFEHAFEADQGGNITVLFSNHRGREVVLSVMDDGRGVDSSAHTATMPSFGIYLVKRLARQLGGNFTLLPAWPKGSIARVAFDIGNSAPAG